MYKKLWVKSMFKRKSLQSTFENVDRTGILNVFGQTVLKTGCHNGTDTPAIRFYIEFTGNLLVSLSSWKAN